MGGDCTFTGCGPSKSLLAAAARGETFTEAMAAVRATVARIAATEDDDALRREGVEAVHGWAVLRSPTKIDVDGVRIRGRRVVLAVGAGRRYQTSPASTGLRCSPTRTCSIWTDCRGGSRCWAEGRSGSSSPQAFARLGSAVTVVEAEPRLLPGEEPEASEVVTGALRRDGASLCTGDQVTEVVLRGRSGAARLRLKSGMTVDAGRVLVATGRRPATAGLGLETVGVAVDERGYVRTDATLAASVPGIWAIGDVTGRMPFTHAADCMAVS